MKKGSTEGMEKKEPSSIAGGNVNWYSRHRKQYGGSLKNYNRGTACVCTRVCACLDKECVQLFVTLWTVTHQAPTSMSMGFPQARIPEWVAISSSKRSSRSRNWTHISPVFYIAGGFFTCWVMEEAQELPSDPASLLLGIYSEKTVIWKDTCTPMVTAVLFIIAKTWKQPKRPSTDEWIKMCYIYTMEYYSAINKDEMMPFGWAYHVKSWLTGKDPDAGRDWGQEEKRMTEDEMAGWHHRLNGHEFE